MCVYWNKAHSHRTINEQLQQQQPAEYKCSHTWNENQMIDCNWILVISFLILCTKHSHTWNRYFVWWQSFNSSSTTTTKRIPKHTHRFSWCSPIYICIRMELHCMLVRLLIFKFLQNIKYSVSWRNKTVHTVLRKSELFCMSANHNRKKTKQLPYKIHTILHVAHFIHIQLFPRLLCWNEKCIFCINFWPHKYKCNPVKALISL